MIKASDLTGASIVGHVARYSYVLPILVMATLMLGYFDRPALFHDELINTYKAERGVIFDYAARPLFYFTNFIAVRAFGGHPLAISLAVTLITFLGGWFTYSYLRRSFGYAAGIAGVAAYSWLGWVYEAGIGAMAHMLPAAFLIAALFCYHKQSVEKIDGWGKVGISALILCALASHPTSVALVVSFYAMVGLSLIRARVKLRINNAEYLAHNISWGGLAVAMPLMLEAAYRIFGNGNASYFGSWAIILERTNSVRYSGYFQPFEYYFVIMAERFYPLLLMLGLALIYWVLSKYRNPRTEENRSEASWYTVELCIYSLVALGLISTQLWKFERVAATFAPIVSLAILAVTFELLRRSGWRSKAASTVVAIGIVLVSLYSFASIQADVRASFPKKRLVYSNFMELIRTVNSDSIAYLGRKEAMRIAIYPVVAAGKRLRHVGPAPSSSSTVYSMIEDVAGEDYRHIIIEADREGGETFSLSNSFSSEGMHKVGSYRNNNHVYELWSLPQRGSRSGGRVVDNAIAAIVGVLDVYVRYDRVSEVQGRKERQIYIEVLGGAIDDAEAVTIDAFANYGFSVRRGMVDSNGVRLQFAAKRRSPVNALIRNQFASPPFDNPAGTSSIYLRQDVE